VLTLLASIAGPAAATQVAHSVVVSDDPANFTPHALNGRVNAIVQVGNKMIAGGDFTTISSASSPNTGIARPYIFAFNATTGAIDSAFTPTLNGVVHALAADPDGSSVLVAGAFKTANGSTVNRVTKLNTANGARVPGFRASASATVLDLVVHGGRAYIAGYFSSVNGTARSALAAIDVATGDVKSDFDVPLAGPRTGQSLFGRKVDVNPQGTRLMVIGNFSSAGGQERHQIAMLDLTRGPVALANWSTLRLQRECNSTLFPSYAKDVEFSPDGSYFVLVNTGGGRRGSLCDTASRWETAATGLDLRETWADETGGDTLSAVSVTGTAIYVGGHQRWMNNPLANNAQGPGAVARSGIAALDPANGLPLSWNPGRSPRGVGVFDLYATPQGLWVTSDTQSIGGEFHGRLALMPLAGGKAIPPSNPGTLPGDLYVAGTDDSLTKRSFDGTTPGAPSTVSTAVAWSRTRGTFMLSGKLFYGWDDGNLYVRSFDGSTLGPATAVDLNGLTSTHIPIASITGMFFDSGRLYYTVSGQNALYWRYFTAESGVLGAERYTANGGGTGFPRWDNVRGMTMANGRIYYALSTDTTLRRIDFANGAPKSGTIAPITDPNGNTWASRGMFVFAPAASQPPPNRAPSASFTVSCTSLVCDFDGRGSTDPDGTVSSYAWDFGDGGTGSGAITAHTYATTGTYTVTLTVTDNRGATGTANRQVTVALTPPSESIGFRDAASANRYTSTHTVTVPAAVQGGDGLVLLLTFADASSTIGEPTGVTGWSELSTVRGTNITTRVWQKVAAASDAGGTVSIPLSSGVKGSTTVMAYSGTSLTAPVDSFAGVAETTSRSEHTTPAVTTASSGTWAVSYWADKTSATTAWTPPAGQTVRAGSYGAGGGRITSLAVDNAAAQPPGTYGTLTATANGTTHNATMWTILLEPR
jgi:PKD repeat protein